VGHLFRITTAIEGAYDSPSPCAPWLTGRALGPGPARAEESSEPPPPAALAAARANFFGRLLADPAQRRVPVAPAAPALGPGAARGTLAGSAFGLLEGGGRLQLVVELVPEDDALCLALACRPLRDAVFCRFPRRRPARTTCERCGVVGGHAGVRLRTRDTAIVATLAVGGQVICA
jgi:hypothetical protein